MKKILSHQKKLIFEGRFLFYLSTQVVYASCLCKFGSSQVKISDAVKNYVYPEIFIEIRPFLDFSLLAWPDPLYNKKKLGWPPNGMHING